MSSDKQVVALVNPGAMGTPVGVAALRSGARVLWNAEGRSAASHDRARAAGFESVESMPALLGNAAMVLSVCPPHAALALAEAVAAGGFKGLYVDANAVSPQTSAAIGDVIETAGADYVDASIVGGPPRQRGTTRLFLAGERAQAVHDALAEGHFDLEILGDAPGAASAIKMAYAAWTKGSDALLLAIRALARAHGVEQALLQEWQLSQPGVEQASSSAVSGSAPKAWRFSGEMEEIADTFEQAGLPDGFHRACAEVYRRLDGFKNATDPELDAVLQALRRS